MCLYCSQVIQKLRDTIRIVFIMFILLSASCIKQIILLQARQYKMYIIYLKKEVLSKLAQLDL
jgi:hypothetical protein